MLLMYLRVFCWISYQIVITHYKWKTTLGVSELMIGRVKKVVALGSSINENELTSNFEKCKSENSNIS